MFKQRPHIKLNRRRFNLRMTPEEREIAINAGVSPKTPYHPTAMRVWVDAIATMETAFKIYQRRLVGFSIRNFGQFADAIDDADGAANFHELFKELMFDEQNWNPEKRKRRLIPRRRRGR
ncbi:hypothetical protein [Crateriforma conspicua]|uniref:Uncharacterized protein n=1 Tax=Crateriforma conspicua TaxID=2527996 RepID=A0A5C5Y3H8_9PLAN|nr:hypothetical protein [Crateriforma conspicua]TWT69359.1 hypothetical protein Pan14r_16450 [Crateriforma conspicua]